MRYTDNAEYSLLEDKDVTHADITPQIIGAAIKVHRRLGPGLLESAYEACLAYELEQLGFHVQRQKAVPLIYESVKLDCSFRADLVVDGPEGAKGLLQSL